MNREGAESLVFLLLTDCLSVAVSLVSQDTQMPRFEKHRSCSLSSELPTDTDTLGDVAQYFISMSNLNTNPLVLSSFTRPRFFVLVSLTRICVDL